MIIMSEKESINICTCNTVKLNHECQRSISREKIGERFIGESQQKSYRKWSNEWHKTNNNNCVVDSTGNTKYTHKYACPARINKLLLLCLLDH